MLELQLMLNLLLYHWPEQVTCFMLKSLFMERTEKHQGTNDKTGKKNQQAVLSTFALFAHYSYQARVL